MSQLTFQFDMRWRHSRQSWRLPEGRELFDPRGFAVDQIAEHPARAFVETHHYSGSWVASRMQAGLFNGSHLVGVAAFSVPTSAASITKWTGLPGNAGVWLGRFVLLDEVAYGAETWFLARALKLLRAAKPDIAAVISYADPVERRTLDGAVIKPGHLGSIYSAGSGRYLGRASPRVDRLTPDGRAIQARALSKIRNEETGKDGAIRVLERAGLDPRRPHEDGRAWLERVLPTLRAVRHPGNLTFAFGLTRSVRRQIEERNTILPKPTDKDRISAVA